MKKTFYRVLACILIAAMVPVTLLFFAFGLPAQYDRTYTAALNDKLSRLAATEGPRIIVIGGSGVAFDLRSDLLEQEIPDYSVVNFGLYAGLGTAVMIEMAEPYIRKDDIVVFMPEQSSQTLSTYFNGEALWQAMDGSNMPWLSLSASEKKKLLGAFPTFAGEKAKLYFYNEKPMGDSIYARSSFNSYGDMACQGRERNVMEGGFDQNMPISFDEAMITDEMVALLNKFVTSCENQGARLYYGFCPMNKAAIVDYDQSKIRDFYRKVEESLDFPILGAPEGSIMEAGWFFDTNFHLNEAGQTAFTATFAKHLKQELGMDTQVNLQVPDMPEEQPYYENKASGDNKDIDCFTYEIRQGKAWITGLTEAGTDRTSLSLPDEYDGCTVVGFESEVFRNNTKLETICIGPNISNILDNSFYGCSGLKEIYINNTKPETISVGSELLEGTKAEVLVPEDAFSDYAVNYFWSVYSSRMKGYK